MAQLVKVKGLKGKQNKKKWAKNIDVSGLLQAKAQQHTQQIRQQHQPNILISDDNDNKRQELDPNRFKNVVPPLPKQKFNNRVVRSIDLEKIDDAWSGNYEGKTKYQKTQIPSIITPESGHSYNPRQRDIQKLKDRVIDYEEHKPMQRKVKKAIEAPVVEIRYRNKNKRAEQLAARARKEEKQRNRQITSLKRIKADLDQKEQKIQEKIKTKKIVKEKLRAETLTGRVRKGPRLSRRRYRFKQYLPQGQKVDQVSKIELKDQTFRDRFDSIYRRGVFQPRNIKVHANRRKNIKVLQRSFIE